METEKVKKWGLIFFGLVLANWLWRNLFRAIPKPILPTPGQSITMDQARAVANTVHDSLQGFYENESAAVQAILYIVRTPADLDLIYKAYGKRSHGVFGMWGNYDLYQALQRYLNADELNELRAGLAQLNIKSPV